MQEAEIRPALTSDLSATEFVRWYWLKSELVDFARELGLPTSGAKSDISARIADRLDGGTGTDGASPTRSVDYLTGALSAHTVIPEGQRMTAHLRGYFLTQCGPDFRFDAHMREFFADGGGRTLGEAVEHWFATRDQPRRAIEAQFEYNTFAQQWHHNHPGGTHSEMVADWNSYRSLPVDRRPPLV